ncbi:MAG: response regulator [Bacteroidales bacterium]|nr:response regulator [Bacteroidales bacterium]
MRILFIDDEIKANRDLVLYLQEFENHHVEWLERPSQVLEMEIDLLKSYDIIILDIMMPLDYSFPLNDISIACQGHSTGIYLIKKIREKTDTPVIIYSARGDVHYLEKKFMKIRFLQKPVSMETLVKELISMTT